MNKYVPVILFSILLFSSIFAVVTLEADDFVEEGSSGTTGSVTGGGSIPIVIETDGKIQLGSGELQGPAPGKVHVTAALKLPLTGADGYGLVKIPNITVYLGPFNNLNIRMGNPADISKTKTINLDLASTFKLDATHYTLDPWYGSDSFKFEGDKDFTKGIGYRVKEGASEKFYYYLEWELNSTDNVLKITSIELNPSEIQKLLSDAKPSAESGAAADDDSEEESSVGDSGDAYTVIMEHESGNPSFNIAARIKSKNYSKGAVDAALNGLKKEGVKDETGIAEIKKQLTAHKAEIKGVLDKFGATNDPIAFMKALMYAESSFRYWLTGDAQKSCGITQAQKIEAGKTLLCSEWKTALGHSFDEISYNIAAGVEELLSKAKSVQNKTSCKEYLTKKVKGLKGVTLGEVLTLCAYNWGQGCIKECQVDDDKKTIKIISKGAASGSCSWMGTAEGEGSTTRLEYPVRILGRKLATEGSDIEEYDLVDKPMPDEDDTPTVTANCLKCTSVLQCLACVDEKAYDQLFKLKAK